MLSLLNESRTFEDCTDQEIGNVSAAAETIQFSAGETIFEAGKPADFLYVVADGSVILQFRVTSFGEPRDITIDRKSRGDVLGWSAATKPITFSLSAIAESECSLLSIRGSDLKRMCAEDDHFGYVFMANMADLIGQRLNVLRRILIDIVQDRMATA